MSGPWVPWSPDNNVLWSSQNAVDQANEELSWVNRAEDDCHPVITQLPDKKSKTRIKVKSGMGIGNGEHRFCWEMCRLANSPYDPHGSISKLRQVQGTSESHDVLVAGMRYEVKESNSKARSFRINKTGFSTLAEFQHQLYSFTKHALDLVSLFDECPSLDEFVKNSERYMLRSWILDDLRIMSEAVSSLKKIKHVTLPWSIPSVIFSVKMDNYTNIVQRDDGKLLVTPQRHPWLRDDGTFDRQLEYILDCSNYFPEDVDEVVIVNAKDGYMKFPRLAANEHLRFVRSSLGFAQLELKR